MIPLSARRPDPAAQSALTLAVVCGLMTANLIMVLTLIGGL